MATATHFLEAIQRHHIPSRVRTDRGVENVIVKEMMEKLCGVGRGSCMQGTSTHNQRIERLWRDVFSQEIAEFYNLFNELENNHGFEYDTIVDKFVVQAAMLKRMDDHIQEWVEGWNCRPSTSLNGKSPNLTWEMSLSDAVQADRPSTSATNILRPPEADLARVIQELDIQDNNGQFLQPRVQAPITQEQLNQVVDTVARFIDDPANSFRDNSTRLCLEIKALVSGFINQE